MREERTDVCEVCKEALIPRRALLPICGGCYTMMECFDFDPAIIRSAIEYVEFHKNKET